LESISIESLFSRKIAQAVSSQLLSIPSQIILIHFLQGGIFLEEFANW